ncbi:MAG: response regulator [Desulfocapsaceae bacterium]|nr:response regulator [Desulfocapsaceae bacterium]
MRRKAVLLVDNDEPILMSLGHCLEGSRYHVKTAQSGEAALAEFQSCYFDLVITGLIMDGINGIDVLLLKPCDPDELK